MFQSFLQWPASRIELESPVRNRGVKRPAPLLRDLECGDLRCTVSPPRLFPEPVGGLPVLQSGKRRASPMRVSPGLKRRRFASADGQNNENKPPEADAPEPNSCSWVPTRECEEAPFPMREPTSMGDARPTTSASPATTAAEDCTAEPSPLRCSRKHPFRPYSHLMRGPTDCFNGMTVRELKAKLKALGIPAGSCNEKSELIDLLRRGKPPTHEARQAPHSRRPAPVVKQPAYPQARPAARTAQPTLLQKKSREQEEVIRKILSAHDHWSAMGLQRGCTKNEVNKRFYLYAKQVHPDKAGPHLEARGLQAFKKLCDSKEFLLQNCLR